MNKNIKIIISEYLQNTISKKDLIYLNEWILKEENQLFYRDFIHTYYKGISYDTEKAFKLFEDATFNRNGVVNLKQKRFQILRYAAMLIFLISFGYSLYYFNQDPVQVLPENEVTLEVEGGGLKILDASVTKDLVGKDGKVLAKQKENTLDYDSSAIEDGEIVFNILRVPYGKTFQVLLPDHTHVYLNAGSSLRYPTKFQKGKEREVVLEGEGYFKVSKNENSPFLVRINGMTTEVFGTEFNITSYTEDQYSSVVLVEGSVGVYDNSDQFGPQSRRMLKPSEMASKAQGGKITIDQVDVAKYISWKDGTLFFKNENFGSIAKKLQRHYNVEITNNYKALEEKKFTGRFDIESIEQILKTFQKTNDFNFNLINNKIIINP